MKVLSSRAKEIIEDITYITIATTSEDGQPWNTPVYSAFDESYNFYWGSHVDAQHSQNIKANSKVFLVIYDSTVPVGEGEGVYVKATAHEITDPSEIIAAHKLLQDRQPIPWQLEQVQGSAPVRLFKAIPEKIWMNEGGEVAGTYVDVRKEVEL